MGMAKGPIRHPLFSTLMMELLLLSIFFLPLISSHSTSIFNVVCCSPMMRGCAPRPCPPPDFFTYYECCGQGQCCRAARDGVVIFGIILLLLLLLCCCCCIAGGIYSIFKKKKNNNNKGKQCPPPPAEEESRPPTSTPHSPYTVHSPSTTNTTGQQTREVYTLHEYESRHSRPRESHF